MARGLRSLQSAPFVAAALVIATGAVAGSPAVAAQSRIASSQAFEGDQFGYSVSFDAGTLVVGAPEVDWVVSDVDGNGAVYVFERRETGEWSEIDRVDYGSCCGAFGSAVAVRGDLLLVGAPHVECLPEVPCGRGLLFERVPSSQRWERVLELNPTQFLVGFDDFGGSVALAGDSTRELLVVGAPGGSFATGQVVVYERDPATGNILSELQLLASDGEEQDDFGRSVAAHGRLVAVGAPGDDDLGSFSGSAPTPRSGTASASRRRPAVRPCSSAPPTTIPTAPPTSTPSRAWSSIRRRAGRRERDGGATIELGARTAAWRQAETRDSREP